jgi:hypothetical protein
MEYRCPACQRSLYDRRLEKCGFCGAEIPQHLRFTAQETAALDAKEKMMKREYFEHVVADGESAEQLRNARWWMPWR